MTIRIVTAFFFACALVPPGAAQQVPIGAGSVSDTVRGLQPGEFIWAPEIAPDGPMLMMINLATQRAILFRNSIPIAASTVSTGRPGYRTPTGVYSVLQKRVEHYSSTYDNAPMPYMQRLTWKGIALHAGNLPGYPASHGCIRLPPEFARLLYQVTHLGMTVMVVDQEAIPKIAPGPPAVSPGLRSNLEADFRWAPDKSPSGPVTIIFSASDRSALVIRNGIVIGSAAATFDGPVAGTSAYTLVSGPARWVRLTLSGSEESGAGAVADWQRFRVSREFRQAITSVLHQGATLIVTADSLNSETANDVTILESESPSSPGDKTGG